MQRFFGGLALVIFLAVASFGPGALVGAIEWPLGVGPFTSEGQACLAAGTVASRLNAMEQAENPAEARAKLRQAGSSIEALARSVDLEAQRRQLERLAASIEASVEASERGDLPAALEASRSLATQAKAVNGWYARTCNSWTIRLPIWLNDVYAGGLPTIV